MIRLWEFNHLTLNEMEDYLRAGYLKDKKRRIMNIIGRTFKVLSWVLFGKGKTLVQHAGRIAENVEVRVGKTGLSIKFKKEF